MPGLSEAAITAIASGASAAAGIAGSAINSAVANRRSYKYTKKLTDYQNELAIQNWNMQNAYNSPAAQMARYQEAGLNPNLIYGSGSASAGNAESVPHSSGGQFNYQKTFDAMQLQQGMQQTLGMYWDNKLKEKQLKNYDLTMFGSQMKNALQQAYLGSLYVYVQDITKSDGTSLPGFNLSLTDKEREEYRHTPWYRSFQKDKISVDQATAIFNNTQKQGELMSFQDWNNDTVKGLFTQDWSNMSIGEVIRGLILMLVGNKGLLK